MRACSEFKMSFRYQSVEGGDHPYSSPGGYSIVAWCKSQTNVRLFMEQCNDLGGLMLIPSFRVLDN